MKSTSFFSLVILVLILTQIRAIAGDQVLLGWNPNSEPDFSHYLIYRCDSVILQPTIPENLIATTFDSCYCDSNVQADSAYYYWVCAVDLYGNKSVPSKPSQVVVVPSQGSFPVLSIEHLDEDQDPEDPFVDRTLDNDNTIEFSWIQSFPESALYRLYVYDNQNPEIYQIETELNSYSFENAVSGRTYRLRVDVIGPEQQIIARGFSEYILCNDEVETVPIPGMPTVLTVE